MADGRVQGGRRDVGRKSLGDEVVLGREEVGPTDRTERGGRASSMRLPPLRFVGPPVPHTSSRTFPDFRSYTAPTIASLIRPSTPVPLARMTR
ncbi:MAG: hypothetical protein MZV64_30005 [Ignavibacteriales bacterium]|nr:hypothetical protein [Ignavibacteriales bacterium]